MIRLQEPFRAVFYAPFYAALARYKAQGLWTADPFYPEEAFLRLEHAMFTAGAITRKPGVSATIDNAIVAEALR